ncbi:unnamed protein product, partial [marine sediment metagenome]
MVDKSLLARIKERNIYSAVELQDILDLCEVFQQIIQEQERIKKELKEAYINYKNRYESYWYPEGIEYEYEVLKKPTFSYLKLYIRKGQTIQCEGGTMIFFDPTLEISTKKASKGFLKSLKRVLAGETFFMNTFKALDDGSLGLAPAFPGDLMHLPLKQNESWILFSG